MAIAWEQWNSVDGVDVMAKVDYWDEPPVHREQIVLFAPMLDSVIGEDHPARLVDEILRSLDWLEWEAKYNGRRGRPPIHPRIMAGVILYGLTRGVRSSRHLEYLIKNNLDFIWLVEGRGIDHATICGFRTNFRQALKDLFRQLGRIALTMGMARLNEVALDGTRVKANNGRFETLTADGIEARLTALDEEFERMLKEAEAADRKDQKLFDTGKSSEKLPVELADLQTRQEQLQKALDRVQEADKARRAAGIDPKENPAQVPTTDPDSRVLPNKEGGYAPNYTPIATTDVHGGFILDVDVITSTTEHLATLSSMDEIKESFGEYPEIALADGAHATGPNMEGMEEREIDFYSHVGSAKASGPNPALRDDPTEPVEKSAQGQLPRNPQTKKFDKCCFVYDEQNDVFYCPQGKVLTYKERKSKVDATGNRTYFRVYRCDECAGCQWSSDCQSQRAKRGRSVSRDEHAERREQFAEKMSRVESQEAYKRRFHAAETPFAVLKQIMKLRQFLLRGLENVKTEWLWACTAHNLRKLIREIGRLRAEFCHLARNGEG